MSYDELQPGMEMDALIAQRVFGWKAWINDDGEWRVQLPGERIRGDGEWLAVAFDPRTGEKHRYEWTHYVSPPAYSYDIAHAWEVVERLPAERDGLRFCLKRDHGGAWTAGYHGLELGFVADCGEADTAPLAICRAALKALAP